MIDEKEFLEIFQDKIFEFEARFNAMIEKGKRFEDAENERRRKLKIKGMATGFYFSSLCSSEREEWANCGVKGLQDLLANKEQIVLSNVYAYVKSEYFSDDIAALKKGASNALSKDSELLWIVPTAALIVGFAWNWWAALGVVLVGGVVGFHILFKKNAPVSNKITEVIKKRKSTVAYVDQKIAELSETERKRFQDIRNRLHLKYMQAQILRQEVARLEREVDALAQEVSYPSRTRSQNAVENSTNSGGGRKEIVDDAGRTQGYVEDGRIYNDKSDVVGYVDSDRRVYDADHRRVGEVGKDGKIEKYR